MVRLVLLRHGESEWNAEDRLSGWSDVDLSLRGMQEAVDAARQIRGHGISLDCGFSSVLKRAIRTLWIVLEEMDRMYLPIHCSWRLNERHYGLLEGRTKQESYQLYGRDAVESWRNDFGAWPPPMPETDPRHPVHNCRYAHLPRALLPSAESLEDTLYRLLPCWRRGIAPSLQSGKNVIVVSHRTSLRALVLHLEGIPADAIPKFDMPTGMPLVYDMDPSLAIIHRYFLEGDVEPPCTSCRCRDASNAED